jgi:hypothetical protein
VDDRALATALAEGRLDGLLQAHDRYAGPLFDYGHDLLGSAEAAIGAVRDALLIGYEQTAGPAASLADGSRPADGSRLPDESRLGAWLYALTRNECVRRLRHARAADLDGELLSLAHRHRLSTADIAAILGVSSDDVTHRLRLARAAGTDLSTDGELPAAPPALRAQLIAGVDPDAAEYRAALVRRAGPFGPDGFPQPLDQRRIGGHVLAWCTAAAVLIALAVLVMLPSDRSSAGQAQLASVPGAGAAQAPVLTSTGQPPFATRDAWPLPQADTLHPGSSAAAPGAPASRDEQVATTPPATGTVASDPVAPAPTGRAPRLDGPASSAGDGALAAWFQNRTAPACTAMWTARVHVVVLGQAAGAVSRVTGSWVDQGQAHPVTLQRSGQEWAATVTGLPTGRQVTLSVRAAGARGAVASGSTRLQYRCS